MAVLDTWKCEANAVEGAKVRARALRFLDMLQGAFQLTWERPEELQKALAELSATEETIAGRDVLVSYLDALSSCLSRPYGVRGREGETDAAQQAKGRHRQTQGASGARGRSGSTIIGEVSEVGQCPKQELCKARACAHRILTRKECHVCLLCVWHVVNGGLTVMSWTLVDTDKSRR